MKTIKPIALGIVMSLVACAHDEPSSKTAYQASSPANPPASTPQASTAADAPAANAPTSADVPHEGANAGNQVAPESGSTEAQGAAMLTDAQILQIVHTGDTGEIDQARLALSKSKDPKVRSLAQMMIRDHTQSDNKGAVIAKKEGLTREPTPMSESIKSGAESATQTLRAEAGADFDKDYVDTQVREHQSLLDAIDNKLTADAKSSDVKAYLTEVRAAVAVHLQHAHDLQK